MYYTEGNRAGRLLAHRLHTQATERRVAELKLSDGTLTCQEEPICQQFEQFYSNLNSAEGVNHKGVEGYLDPVPVARLPPVDSAILENYIMSAEVLVAIYHLQPGKARGTDVFGVEFYKSFGTVILCDGLTLRSDPSDPWGTDAMGDS
ncbi:hypothetical protein NDU88_007334 [Pleurodeles waltl]|uniref:Uncharacterized protein n=1 Tax=Pleurodeles waltl TaxID=8319 RepID=A0AAV7UPT8_PLEWA|nr:hypothetical protein NDU88_007334 [Pleurodeles waltl]